VPEAEAMMAPYLLRLLCLCLAVFFVVHSLVGMVISLSGRAAVNAARRMRPRLAARFLLALRLLPAAFALFVVAGLCVPSYLWLEPEISAEEVGAGCLTAAILATALWTLSTARGVRAAVRSVRHARVCERLARLSTVPGSHLFGSHQPVWILNSQAPVVALVGLFRSRLMISSPVLNALTPGQLAAALRHEEAHRVSRDNLKRLLLMLAPGLLPGFHGFHTMERGWARFSEWAADDDAVEGDAHRSLSLAAALVRIARMGGVVSPVPLTTYFLGDSREISARVDRLLSPAPAEPARPRNTAVMTAGLALAAACVAGMVHPATLESAHRIIEQLIH
jgi:Zn-dependent protease with chaperone function